MRNSLYSFEKHRGPNQRQGNCLSPSLLRCSKVKTKGIYRLLGILDCLPRIKKIAAHSCSLAIVTGPHDTQYQIKDAQQGCKRSPTTTSDRRLPPFPVFLKLTQAYFVERIGQKFTGLRSNWDCHSSHLACKYFASVRKFCVVTI